MKRVRESNEIVTAGFYRLCLLDGICLGDLFLA